MADGGRVFPSGVYCCEYIPPTLEEGPNSFEIPVTRCELENCAYRERGGGGVTSLLFVME